MVGGAGFVVMVILRSDLWWRGWGHHPAVDPEPEPLWMLEPERQSPTPCGGFSGA